MQTDGFNSSIAAHVLAAQERRQTWLADAHRHRLGQPVDARPTSVVTAIEGCRAVLVVALRRAGRLGGTGRARMPGRSAPAA